MRGSGQLFIGALEGKRIRPEEKRWLEKVDVGGVILFRRNIESPQQLFALCQGIRRLRLSAPPLIAIDHEGGQVNRLPEEYLTLPPAEFFGQRCASGARRALFRRLMGLMAGQLRASGINLNFAPVVDLLPPRGESFMKTRAFGRDPRLAGTLAADLIRAYRRLGLLTCAKHFPGHGATARDSHLELPRLGRTRAQLLRRELLPYRQAIAAGVPLIMTAHILYRALDRCRPATLSPAILQGLLRKKLGYRGLIVSDDLEMKGVSAGRDSRALTLGGLAAGNNLLLFCRDLAPLVAGWQALNRRLAEGDEALQLAALASRQLVDQVKRAYCLDSFRGTAAQLKAQLARPDGKRLLAKIAS